MIYHLIAELDLQPGTYPDAKVDRQSVCHNLFKPKNHMWVEITALNQVPEWGVLKMKVEDTSLILNRQGAKVTCYRNACSHLEYPIDMGKVNNGMITCPFHKYQFKLDSGKCVNAPADSLESYPVKIEGDRVFVEIE